MRCYARDPAGGANSAPSELLAGLWGDERKGKGKGEGGRKGKDKEVKGEKGEERRRGQRKGREKEGEGKRKRGREEFCAVVIFPIGKPLTQSGCVLCVG